jgi:hypothetical protein
VNRNTPPKASSRIQNTNLAELRMVWSTGQDSLTRLENERGEKQKKVPGDEG